MMIPTVMVALCSSTRLWLIWGLVTTLLTRWADIRLSLPGTESLLSWTGLTLVNSLQP